MRFVIDCPAEPVSRLQVYGLTGASVQQLLLLDHPQPQSIALTARAMIVAKVT